MNGQSADSEIHPADPVTKLKIWATDPVESSTIHGVENELLIIQKMLGKPPGDGGRNGFKAIGIIGVGGIGKSALCRAVLQNPEVKSKFLPRIWVSMSKKFTDDTDPKMALLNRILFCLGAEVDMETQTLGGLLYALRLQLRGKRYLIVLDDAQEEQGNGEEVDWYRNLNSSEEIGEKLRDGFRGGKGGAVIVTSRSEKEAKAMVGEGNLRCLVPQKDPESFWEIFRQEVEKGGHYSNHIPSSSSSNLKELKVELMNKCGGLPLAAKMMGQIKFNEIHLGNMDNPPQT